MNEPLQLKDVEGNHRVTDDDSDVVLRYEEGGTVSIPSDANQPLPVGFQFGVESFTDTVSFLPDTGVVIAGASRLAVGPLKTGVLVKQNANFWLLSLGQGSGGGGGGEDGSPDKPIVGWNDTYTFIGWLPVTGTAGPTLGYGALVLPATCSYEIVGTQLNINNVVPDVTYTFEVWGVNCVGKGLSSDTLSYRWASLAAPTLTGLSGAGQVSLTWTDIPGATQHLIQFKKSSASTWSEVLVDDLEEYVVGGLFEEVPFDFRVQARKNPVSSEWSNTVTFTPGPGITDPPVVTHDAGVGSWTITNYDGSLLYSVQASAGTATVSGNKVTGGDPNCTLTLTARRAIGAPPASTVFSKVPYAYDYTPSRYVCTNETFDNCGSPNHPDGSYYCSCGTLGGCGNPNDCCGWVCHAGYNTSPYYTINRNPPAAGYQPSSSQDGQFASPPNPPPGEWFKIGG